MTWVEFLVALAVILGSAELFTNGLEWLGENLGIPEGAVGSVLAAVGTALPETILPLVAILLGEHAGDEIGIGAILGAPFMLSTVAMFIMGVSVLIFSRKGARSSEVRGDRRVILQDLGYFLVMYALALVAGVVHASWFKWALAGALLIGYGVYVARHFTTPGEETEEAEAVGEIRPLYFGRLGGSGRARPPVAGAAVDRAEVDARPFAARPRPHTWIVIAQTMVALIGMILGARVFVAGIHGAADQFGIPQLILALLIAPLATELPEKFNSVIWLRRKKDTLAMGNVTGAMVFQSSFPVTIGLLLTPWHLNTDALVAGIVTLVAGSVLWVTLKTRKVLPGKLLLVQGAFFAGYVVYVLARL